MGSLYVVKEGSSGEMVKSSFSDGVMDSTGKQVEIKDSICSVFRVS